MRYILPLVCIVGILAAGSMDANLRSEIAAALPGEKIPVMILTGCDLDLEFVETATAGMGYWERREFVIDLLQSKARAAQQGILDELATYPEELVSGVKSFWLVNAVYCHATPEVIESIRERGDVAALELGRHPEEGIALIEPTEVRDVEAGDVVDGNAWGVDKINAPGAWGLGYEGAGIIVAIVDTGVNYNHVDLADHMWSGSGYTNGWDFYDNDGDPMDDYGHGSHCAGSVASDGTAGTVCGVAPEATIMALRIDYYYGGESTWIAAWEFGAEYGARVLSTSLGEPHGSMSASFRTSNENLLALGMCSSISAGNSGPGSQTIGSPGDCPPPWLHPDQPQSGGLSAVTTVGATDSGDNIASFSSRGHSTWGSDAPWYDYPDTGGGLIDPDVSGPGVNVTSCTWPNNNSYTTMSGTSMAAPHVAGLMALILDANPSLSPAQVEEILETTSLDLGSGGKDNTYGAGRIDAYEAVQEALGTGVAEDQSGLVPATGLHLSPVVPNPVTGSMEFSVSMTETGTTELAVFDLTGRKVAVINQGMMEDGVHTYVWTPPAGVGSGLYFLTVTSPEGTATERFTVVR